MINLAVINVKDIIKILKIILIIVIAIIVISKFGSDIIGNVSLENIKSLGTSSHTGIIDKTILISEYLGNNYQERENRI